MDKPKIYCSDCITNGDTIPITDAIERFEELEGLAKELGFEPVNPMKLPHRHDKSWDSYMIENIRELISCDAILMGKKWEISKGAKIEHLVAKAIRIDIFYFDKATKNLAI